MVISKIFLIFANVKQRLKQAIMEYVTENGYEVRETIGGLEVSEYGNVICTLDGMTLSDYAEDEVIDDEALEADIEDMAETESFIDYQREYC